MVFSRARFPPVFMVVSYRLMGSARSKADQVSPLWVEIFTDAADCRQYLFISTLGHSAGQRSRNHRKLKTEKNPPTITYRRHFLVDSIWGLQTAICHGYYYINVPVFYVSSAGRVRKGLYSLFVAAHASWPETINNAYDWGSRVKP